MSENMQNSTFEYLDITQMKQDLHYEESLFFSFFFFSKILFRNFILSKELTNSSFQSRNNSL